MHQSLRGGIIGALIYYYFADASTICDASMHDSGHDTQRPNSSPTFYRALANGSALPCPVPPCPLLTVVSCPVPPCPLLTSVLIDCYMVVMHRNMLLWTKHPHL